MTIEELENQLKSGPPVEAKFAREQVLGAVAGALAETQPVSPASVWPWVAIAAAVIVALNFAVIGGSLRRFSPRPQREPMQMGAAANELEAMDPEITPTEIRRMTILAAAGADLPAVPDLVSPQATPQGAWR